MSEKLKPNFTPVPNVIFDEVMATLTPGAVKVLFAICRYTYGWGKTSDRISLNQLSAMTGMNNRGNVRRAVRQLGNLVIVKPGNPRTNQASEYRINIDISDLDLVSPEQQGLVSQRQQASVRPSVKSEPIRRNTKERRESGANAPHALSVNEEPKSAVGKQLLSDPPNPPHPKETRTRAPSAVDSRIRDLFAWWGAEYEIRFRVKYVFNGAKEGALIKRLPADYDIAKLKDFARRFFDSDDDWIKQRGGYTLGVFLSQLNKLASIDAVNSGHAKPAQVKDLGNGLVEIDGLKMTRQTYERKYERAS